MAKCWIYNELSDIESEYIMIDKMYNLIGNSCISSYITTSYLKDKFINPFTWCVMDFESCYNLVKYWDELNFENYELVKDDKWNFSIIIDGKVKVQYVHYKFSTKYSSPTKVGEDILYNKIWEYIIEKYKERIKRMKELNIDPIFIFAYAANTKLNYSFTLEQQNKIVNLHSKYKIIFSFKEMINTDEIKCIKTSYYNGNTKEMAGEIYKEINIDILT